jgi:pantoate--beta-alanine ligase
MIIFKKREQLFQFIDGQKKLQRKIGFVPTMGALHRGHLSLVTQARKGNDIVVCSIFINPTQFNNPDDLRHYPITIEADIELLLEEKCDALFLPAVEEVYPPGYQPKFYELGPIENVLEGFYRPGHFQGVCQVVDLLLDIVRPDNLYMGQKDFQQCLVVRKLINVTGREKEVELNIVTTKREHSGLAMSSRNLRLDEKQKAQATLIYSTLQKIKEELHSKPIAELKQTAKEKLESNGFVVDYVEISHAEDLSPAAIAKGRLVALVAATIGNIRLIDNLVLN